MRIPDLNAIQLQRQESLNAAIEVIAASPGVLKSCSTGKELADELTTLADGILAYIKKAP